MIIRQAPQWLGLIESNVRTTRPVEKLGLLQQDWKDLFDYLVCFCHLLTYSTTKKFNDTAFIFSFGETLVSHVPLIWK